MLNEKKQTHISRILLFLLICSININGSDYFFTKEIFFVLFMLFSISLGRYNNIFDLLALLLIYLFSAVVNLATNSINATSSLMYLPGLFYLVLLLYAKKEYKDVIIKSYLMSSAIVALLIITIWLICIQSITIQNILIKYFESVKNDRVAFLFMIRKRKFLSWWFLGVYYGTAPCMIASLGYCLYSDLKRKSWRKIALSVLYIIALIMSGARANILAALILYIVYIGFKLIRANRKLLGLILLNILMVSSFLVISILLSEKKEGSIIIKNLHKGSYFELFNDDFLRTVFTGWGAGSTFFSKGYNDYTTITELTIYETIRRYGLISTVIIFLFIWLKPIKYALRKKRKTDKLYLILIVLAYISVACTNPFLIGGVGFCALLFVSTFMQEWE